jgi:hypothetical protein
VAWEPAPSSSGSETTALNASPDLGLEPDEHVVARAHASFRGALAATVRSTFSPAASRNRMSAYDAWAVGARAVGFPADGPEMLLGCTQHRLVSWRTSFFFDRPVELLSAMPLTDIVDVAVAPHGLVTGVAFVVRGGAIIEVEALRGRALRRLAAAVTQRMAGA